MPPFLFKATLMSLSGELDPWKPHWTCFPLPQPPRNTPTAHIGPHETPAFSPPFLTFVQNKLKTQNKDSNKRLKQIPNLPKERVTYPLEV